MVNKKPEEWEGTANCQGVTLQATRCSRREIEGLGYCFSHVPDDMLEEAEMVTGMRRCVRMKLGDNSERCHNAAEPGGLVCDRHGGQARPQAGIGGPAVRHAEGLAAQELVEIMTASGTRWLMEPAKVENPYEALKAIGEEMNALKDKIRVRVADMDAERWRYSHSKIGEQTSAWILLYERALERCAAVWLQIAKLGIDERLAKLEERQIDLIETAFRQAMAESGLPIDKQEELRENLGRHLQSVA
jgi:hypothetical protein